MVKGDYFTNYSLFVFSIGYWALVRALYLTLSWGISSDGRALALHVRGTGIDARILQLIPNIFAMNFDFVDQIKQTPYRLEYTLYARGISSDGRALASHVRGTGIDARILQLMLLSLLLTIYTRKNIGLFSG